MRGRSRRDHHLRHGHARLKDRGRLAAGETVAVLGASGGAGLAAVEIAKALGARVIWRWRLRRKSWRFAGSTARIR